MQTTQSSGRVVRGVALMTGGVLMASALLPPIAARADDEKKSKDLKTGAVVLGAAAAFLILKGKTLPAAAAGAGAYYAYKKSKDIENQNQSARYPNERSDENRTAARDRYPADTSLPRGRTARGPRRTDSSYPNVDARYPDVDNSDDGSYGDDTNGDTTTYPTDSGDDYAYDPGYDGAYNGLARGARKLHRAAAPTAPASQLAARGSAPRTGRDKDAAKPGDKNAVKAPARTVLK
jgi:hypothetical protein